MSAYQTNGKPLSQQALYQQRLRSGVYHSPGAPIVGVSSSASDSAALLAASADLTVKPSYERLRAAPEAQTAAIAARLDSISSWKRESTDPNADAAAANARRPAAAVGPASELGVPANYNKSSIYSRASTNSTYSISSRTNPEKLVTKHGLASVPRSGANSLNIAKISQLADKNSTRTLSSRFNPEQDYRHGIKSPPAKYLDDDEEAEAASSAAAALTMKHGGGYTHSVSSVRRSKGFEAVDVVDSTLIAAASKKAAERLNSLQAIGNSDLRAQAQVYSKALVAAHKASEERIKQNKAGMIDLGGGLQLPYSEIDKMAALIVGPVLSDIDKKAAAQRELDVIEAGKRKEAKEAHKNYKLEEAARKQREKEAAAKEQQDRIVANEKRKREEDEAYTLHQKKRHEEVNTKNQEFTDLQAQYATEKEALLTEKQEHQDQIDEEETGLKNGRKEELDGMQAERDEEIKPLLDELEEENAKLAKLTEEKEGLTTEVEAAEKQKEEQEAKIAELEAKLEEIENDHTHYTTQLGEATTKREAADKEVEELHKTHETSLQKHKESHDDLDARIKDLEKQKEQHNITRDEHKRQILKELDDKVKDEHQINEELPEHLRSEVNEKKIRDVGSLFDDPFEKKPAAAAVAKEAEPKVESKSAGVPEAAIQSAPKAETAKAEAPKVEAKAEKKAAKTAAPKVTEEKTKSTPETGKTKQKYRSLLDPVEPKKTEEGTSERKGLRKRLSSFTSSFRSSSKEEVPTTKSIEKKAADKAERSSDVSNFEDDLSIKDGNKKGGVFKEEI